MPLLLLTLAVAASPVLRIDLRDALRLPSGVETPPGEPLVIYVKAPPSWVSKGALTEAGKQAVLAKLYGGPDWMKGNDDGSTYVVKALTSKVLASPADARDGKGTLWYEVKPDGTLDERGPGFGEPLALKQPGSLLDHAEPGSVFEAGPAVNDPKLADWLGQQQGLVKLPLRLKRGQVGFTGRGARLGPLTVDVADHRLGVSLADRARQHCGDAPACALWLIGDWKGKTKTGYAFDVSKVEGPVPAGELGERAWRQVPK